MPPPDDESLRAVLTHLGVDAAALLGHGGEARVYALDDQRVVRILHPGSLPSAISRRDQLVVELRRGGAGFALPWVLEIGEVEGRHFSVERRLPGRPVPTELDTLDRADRDRLIEHHLAAAGALGSLHLDHRGWFGELLSDDPLRASTWRGYLFERVARSLQAAPAEFHHLDPAGLADALPDTRAESFVHLDAFAANMLADGTTITAVLDIGDTSVVGDARLDPASAGVYFCASEITPVANERDIKVVFAWLRSNDLLDWYEPARRWLAAYWSWAVDDKPLHRWCRSVLLGGGA